MINILSAAHQRKASQGKVLDFFLLDALKTAFQMRHLTHRWAQSGYLFQKPGHFFFDLLKEPSEIFFIPFKYLTKQLLLH